MIGYFFTSAEHEGPCSNGMGIFEHPFDALEVASGNWLHQVLQPHNNVVDKCVGGCQRIIVTVNSEFILCEFARWCALQTIDLWDGPTIVRQYFETGDESFQEEAYRAVMRLSSIMGSIARKAKAGKAKDGKDVLKLLAWNVAWSATDAGGGYAAWDVAWDAATCVNKASIRDEAVGDVKKAFWDETRKIQRDKFAEMVEEAFSQVRNSCQRKNLQATEGRVMRTKTRKLGKSWWITGEELVGPYNTRAEAEEDRKGLARAEKYEDDHGYWTTEKEIDE